MSRAELGLMLVLIVATVIVATPHAVATPPIPVNQRVFYFTSSDSLSAFRPIGSALPTIVNLTKGPLTFALPQLQAPLSIVGQITFVLYTNWTVSRPPPSGQVSIVGILSYHYPSLDWTNRTSNTVNLQTGAQNVTIPLTVSEPPLIEQSTVTVQIKAVSYPTGSNVSILYASTAYPSLVVIPMSGYETLSPSNTVSILDGFGNPPTCSGNQPNCFDLNAPAGSRTVLVKLAVSSALGYQDIKQVNMTIVDPSQRPVHNATMQPSTPQKTSSPYDFIASWSYPSNSTKGTYQVWVNVIDIQNKVAFSFQGPSSFGLGESPGSISLLNSLLPYIVVAGVAVSGGTGGLAFFRRRKGKNYLIPFDHFNTLTGGGLNGGTIVTVEGNTGSGKTLLVEQLMGEDLRNGRPCVFVSTGDFPNSIRASMKTMGIDVSGYEQNGLLTFVDAYSAEAGQESREKLSVPSLGDLTTLGIKLTSAFPSPSFKGGSLYFDSLTPLASKSKPETIVSFVQSVGARVKGLAGKAFFTIGLGIDDAVQRQLEDTADCIVQMEAFEESGSRKRRLRIAKFRARKHQEGWSLFTIEDGKGIIFYSRKPKS